jgi:hypothetical protein
MYELLSNRFSNYIVHPEYLECNINVFKPFDRKTNEICDVVVCEYQEFAQVLVDQIQLQLKVGLRKATTIFQGRKLSV